MRVESQYNADKKFTTTTLSADIFTDYKCKVKYNSTTNNTTWELKSGPWKLDLDLCSHDIAVQRSFNTSLGDLKVAQKLPASNWHLVGTPQFTLDSGVVKADRVKDRLKLSHDMQSRTSSISEKVTLDNKYSIKAKANSKTGVDGVIVTAAAKIDQPLAKKLSVKYSKTTGPSLKYIAAPVDHSKVKAVWRVQTQAVDVYLEAPVSKAIVTLNSSVKLSGTEKFRPTFIAGIKYDL